MKKYKALIVACAISVLVLGACSGGGSQNTGNIPDGNGGQNIQNSQNAGNKQDGPNTDNGQDEPETGDTENMQNPIVDIIDGGVINNSYDAPTEIGSKAIASFKTDFYLSGRFDEKAEGGYSFSIEKNAAGKTVLTEDNHFNISVEIGEDILTKLQAIIDDNELAKLNGTDKHTSGLPVEYSPCLLRAVYDSGEELYFSVNNDPEAKWAAAMVKLFKEEFIRQGHEELLPSKEDRTLTGFSMGYTDGRFNYSYETAFTQSDVGSQSVHFMREAYGREDSTDGFFDIIEIPSDFYSRLAELLSSLDLEDCQNGEIPIGSTSELDSYAFFCMEMESGLQINAYYEGEEAGELCGILAQVAEYLNGFFA